MNTAQDPAAAPPAFRAQALDMIATLAGAMAIALVLRVALFEPFTIPSDSMEPGLQTGDYIVVSKWDYGWSRYSIPLGLPLFSGRVLQSQGPSRGDVVVFKLPRDPKETWVKRVIGLPGDRVQVRAGTVFVNDKPVLQSDGGLTQDPGAPDVTVQRKFEHRPDGRAYVTFDRGPFHDGDDTGVYRVPEGNYLMMGDNRDNSLDGRWPGSVGVGFVPAENIVGQARIVLLSWHGASILKPWTWLNVDLGRFWQLVK